ncbi:MAG: hypothetical protein CL910_13275 [Deltaproteobacteria bacterium]|nr:hypothetical protein [Deltaproteobacteria bacterium]
MSGVSERANPRPLPVGPFFIAAFLAVVGVLAFAAGLARDPAAAWIAFHTNTLYFGSLAQGGGLLAAIFVIVGARWPGPVRRITESLAAWVPVTFILVVISLAFGREYIYEPWLHGPPPGKEPWLNMPRLAGSNLFVLGLLTLLTLVFLRASNRPYLKGAAEGAQGFAKTMFERWTSGWRGDEEEKAASADRLRVLAPIVVLTYAMGYSLIGFDQIMSLTPTWFSNLFGGFFAWGGFLSAVSATTLIAVLLRGSPGLEGALTTARFHDLGKMIFAFSIFWMYLFFSQYLVIWYGNLPEETQFFQARLGSEFLQGTWYFSGWGERVTSEPWVIPTLFAWVCIWVIPFWCLLGQKAKKTPGFLGSIALISLLGFWVERNVLVWPSLVPEDSYAFLGNIQVGIALGFLGLFAMTVMAYQRLFPTLLVPGGEE